MWKENVVKMEIEVEQASSVSLLAGAQCFDLLFLSWF